MFSRQKVLLLATLISSIVVFFVSNFFIFFGRSSFFSVRKNVYEAYISQVGLSYASQLEQIEVFCRRWADGDLASEIFKNFSRRSRSREKSFPEVGELPSALSSLRCFNKGGREIFRWARKEPTKEPASSSVQLGFFLLPQSRSLFLGVGRPNANLQDGSILFEVDLGVLFSQVAQRRPGAFVLGSLRLLPANVVALSDRDHGLPDHVLQALDVYVEEKNLVGTRVYFPEHRVSVYSRALFPKGLRVLYLYGDNLFGVPPWSLLWLLFLTLNCLLFFYLTFMFGEEADVEGAVGLAAPSKPKPQGKRPKKAPKSTGVRLLSRGSGKPKAPSYDFDLSKSIGSTGRRSSAVGVLSEVPEEFYRKKSRVNKTIINLLNDIEGGSAAASLEGPVNFKKLCEQLRQTERFFSRAEGRQMVPLVKKLCAPYRIHFIVVLERREGAYHPFQSQNLNKRFLAQFVLKTTNPLIRDSLSFGKPVLLRDDKSIRRLLGTVLVPSRRPKSVDWQLLFFPVLQGRVLEFVVVLA